MFTIPPPKDPRDYLARCTRCEVDWSLKTGDSTCWICGEKPNAMSTLRERRDKT